MAVTGRPSAMASTASHRNKSVSIDVIAKEGIDQLLCFAGELRDHPDSEPLGEGQKAAVEAIAQQHFHSGGGEALEALQPVPFRDRDPADATDPPPVELGDQKPVRRAEPGGHIIAVKGNAQHRSVLPASSLFASLVLASLVPDQEPCDGEGLVGLELTRERSSVQL